MRLSRLGLVALPGLALSSPACGARAPEELALAGGERARIALAAEVPLRVEPDGTAVWVEHALAPEAWRPGEETHTWIAVRPDGVGFMKSGEELALVGPAGAFVNRPEVDNPADLPALEAGEFAAVGELLHLVLAPDARPAALVFAVRKPRVHGARPVLGAWTGEGFSLWPGERMTFRTPLAPARALGFTFCAEGLFGARRARAELRVSLDGTELARVELEADARGAARGVRLELPPAGARAGELAFELVGEPVLAAVLAPRIGPARLPPTPRARPDLVLFLADTFRADNLAHLGGAPELAPELERLAQRGLAFTNARAPSTWTLPSQASMLSGLYPEQHGATSLGHALPEEVTTLAEQLARHGYRTCAVTDSAFVSRHYGLDQGFECFQELRTWSLRATLAAAHAFLDADDGRPVFLFVQTYRTHMPYRTGADEDRRALEETVRALKRGHPRQGGDGSIDDATAGARMRALYDEGVRALDADFGAFWREREARARGPLFLAFTSDHGEAFLEHGELGHGGAPWEEKVRIPLFLVGPGLAPARVAHAATLVDLPRTLCRLADVPLAPTFEGRDLVELAREALQPPRPAYTFVRIGPESMVAVLEGPRKLYAVADPARLAAGEFVLSADLELDPDERNVLEPQPWARELAAGHARAIEELARALATPARVELSDEDRAFLDAIGYGGER